MLKLRIIAVLAISVLAIPVLASCGTPGYSATLPIKASWSAPKNPLELTRKAGLVPERHETLIHHVHAHLDVFVNGKQNVVPAGIGINVHDPGVHHSGSGMSQLYGGIAMCRRPCISPLHTHDTSGILHTESASPIPHRLGQFFIEWGVRLSAHCVNVYCSPATQVGIYVDGKRYQGDPTTIQLLDRREIAVVVGTPPKHIPSIFP
jgi:hypothetical protein